MLQLIYGVETPQVQQQWLAADPTLFGGLAGSAAASSQAPVPAAAPTTTAPAASPLAAASPTNYFNLANLGTGNNWMARGGRVRRQPTKEHLVVIMPAAGGALSRALPPTANQMPGAMPPQTNLLNVKWQITVRVVTEMMQILMRVPGIDQQLITQARMKIGEAVQLISQAMRSVGGAPQ
jgi:hypothetical protein